MLLKEASLVLPGVRLAVDALDTWLRPCATEAGGLYTFLARQRALRYVDVDIGDVAAQRLLAKRCMGVHWGCARLLLALVEARILLL